MLNRRYILSVTLMAVVIPVAATLIEGHGHFPPGIGIFGKWFIFSAAGLRLLIAGLKQCFQPSFTAREIFRLTSGESYPVIRELGLANLCFGITAIVSLFKPEWRVVSAFCSGLYYFFAGMLHVIKRPAGSNEKFAMWSDLFIFCILACYVYRQL